MFHGFGGSSVDQWSSGETTPEQWYDENHNKNIHTKLDQQQQHPAEWWATTDQFSSYHYSGPGEPWWGGLHCGAYTRWSLTDAQTHSYHTNPVM